ncbi:MAG TPA: class I SAM-dependent methyltransferase [Bdellovibrionota bacterium]|nr:class I SAM-dependent methyltransferase [Bdellovibrionota bacterium]
MIAEKRYHFVKTFETADFTKQYIYSFDLANGEKWKFNFSIPLDGVSSWEDYLSKSKNAESDRRAQIGEAVSKGRFRLLNVDVMIVQHCKIVQTGELIRAQKITDIGSGTGNFSRIFLQAKHRVFGVEPSQNFRLAAERLLSQFPNYMSIEGSAEKTTLSDSSVDLISVGQALHWFDIPDAHIEFQRILKPKSPIVLAWNFAVPDSPYFSEYKKVLKKNGSSEGSQSNEAEVIHQELITSFSADGFSRHKFHHEQKLDWEGFVGLKLSGGEIPVAGKPGHKEALDDLHAFFGSLQKSGEVSIPYETRVYVGFLPR